MKTLAIVGSDPNSRHLAPYDDPSIDIWVFNEAGNHPWCKRWSAVFQMHDPNIYKGTNTKDPNHWEWLQQDHRRPIYMQTVDPLVPNSVRYPIEAAERLAGAEMFTTTFAYMAALAIMQGYGRIEIYGMGLSSSEYDYQRFGFSYWVGFLRGRLGAENVVNTITHMDRDIFQSPRYGYEGNHTFGAEYYAQRAELHGNSWKAAEKNLKNLRERIGEVVDQYDCGKMPELIRQYQAAAMLSGEHAGALSEAERYQKFGSRYADRGGFENAAAQAQQEIEPNRTQIYYYGGMLDYVWNVWKQNRAAERQLPALVDKIGEAAYKTGAMLGMYNENVGYLKKYDTVANAGGRTLLEEK